MSPACSVVVCTRNRSDQLDKCLRAVRNLCYSNFDIVVVDNGDENETTQQLAERWSAKYVREPVVVAALDKIDTFVGEHGQTVNSSSIIDVKEII